MSTVPFERKATVWKAPPVTATTFAMPLTCTGAARAVKLPSPTWPLLFRPQPHSEPSPHIQSNDSTALSSNGRFIAFVSLASNLVPGDTSSNAEIFVYDRQLSQMQRVSVGTGGAESNGQSQFPSISGDGRYVSYASTSNNLVAGDSNGKFDIFVYDRTAAVTQRASVGPGGAQSNGDSFSGSLSSDGRYVAFSSNATNLVAGDTNGKFDIFVRDLTAGGVTTRVSVATGGGQSNGDSYLPAISGDGRYVAYSSTATNLVAGDTNGKSDVFLYDRNFGTTTRVTVGTGGAQANGDSLFPALSADGTVVGFTSFASNLVPGDTNSVSDVFVKSNP